MGTDTEAFPWARSDGSPCGRCRRRGRRDVLPCSQTAATSICKRPWERRAIRQQLLDGVDPLDAKERARAEQKKRLAERERAMTFRQCFEKCLASHEDGWKNAEHRRQWRTSIEQDVLPVIGDLAVDDIGTPHIIKVLEPIWKAKPETASRTRGRIERILAWATVRGFRS